MCCPLQLWARRHHSPELRSCSTPRLPFLGNLKTKTLFLWFLFTSTWLLLCTAAFTLMSANLSLNSFYEFHVIHEKSRMEIFDLAWICIHSDVCNSLTVDEEEKIVPGKMQKSRRICIHIRKSLIQLLRWGKDQTWEDAEIHEETKTSTLDAPAGPTQFRILALKVQKRLKKIIDTVET